MRFIGPAIALLALVVGSGCLSPSQVAAVDARSQQGAAIDPVVIAVLDSGLSPYYEIMRTTSDSWAALSVPLSFTTIAVEAPSPNEDPRERDSATWNSLQPSVLYHFKGTRLFGISFDEERQGFPFVRDAHGHGAGTSYVAARDAPEAVIVVVQVGLNGCADASCLQSPSVATGMEWIAAQHWIDVVSVSIGSPYNLPDPDEVHPEVARYLRASEAAAASGKIIVNSAGNEPTPSLANHNGGPPWVILVGGVESTSKGEQVIASKSVDLVANYTEYAPRWGAGEMEWRGGTSFSTPVVAGTIAHALGKIRTIAPERTVTPEEIRLALNASATYFGATDWDPTAQPRREFPADLVERGSLPILIQPQMGWGYVNSSLAPEIARRVLENDLSIPAGKEQAAIFQAEWQRAREEYWARYA